MPRYALRCCTLLMTSALLWLSFPSTVRADQPASMPNAVNRSPFTPKKHPGWYHYGQLGQPRYRTRTGVTRGFNQKYRQWTFE